ncbi:Gamma-DL-glutamyl hydrolase precursor [Enhygromyxa salina]|uniref:Gamma-DL-glutamyl hydrolase n=1 Tax=Enhygromyxa salina TaxID=215803 RepID=A0A2S9YFI4_9BACT|nr:NlpC/P60 family protein [Enhygromyxa salina]PRQ03870.1 Gamma-DL-glutamyl hydrolase precursor [Enhygromyxa salina]
MDERLAVYLRAIRERLDALRGRLRERYGWTHMELELELEPLRPALIVSGEIAVPSLRGRIVEALTPMLLDDMELDLRLHPMRVREWYAVPRVGLELWAQHPSQPRRSLATELEPADGPVGHLAHDGPGMLLRARDGTVGWASGLLGEAGPARPLQSPRTRAAAGLEICAAARTYLDTPYLLGGASPRRIDCSALVQRAYERALGLLLPRNSHDQLAVGDGGQPCGTAEGEPGELIFIHSRAMQRLHVGIVGDSGTIIHASRSRAAVIEEPQVEFQLDAQWLHRVSIERLVSWALGQAGRAHVELPRRRPD